MMRHMESATRYYRALISVPIVAETDDEASSLAIAQAHSLLHPGGGVAGHLEMLAEVQEGTLQMLRVVDADPGLLTQLPHDWKP
jgi:hypothetical protein